MENLGPINLALLWRVTSCTEILYLLLRVSGWVLAVSMLCCSEAMFVHLSIA